MPVLREVMYKYYYFEPDRVAKYCDDHAYLCVCLSACARLSRTTHRIFTKFFVHVAYGHGSVFLWHHCDTLCTSSNMDDVIFAHSGLYAGMLV